MLQHTMSYTENEPLSPVEMSVHDVDPSNHPILSSMGTFGLIYYFIALGVKYLYVWAIFVVD